MAKRGENTTPNTLTLGIALTPEASRALDAFCAAGDRKKKHVVSQLIHWFVSLDPEVQDVMYGCMKRGDASAVVRHFLERLSRASPLEPSRRERVAG
jgi:hypothetical protein